MDANFCLSDWPQAREGNKRRACNGGRVIILGGGRVTPTRCPPFHCLSPWQPWTLHRCWLVAHGIGYLEPVVGTVQASQEWRPSQRSQGSNNNWIVCGTGAARLIVVDATGCARDACTQSVARNAQAQGVSEASHVHLAGVAPAIGSAPDRREPQGPPFRGGL